MSEEATAQLDNYEQNSDPTDSYQPGTGKQRIDLDEYYKETGQQEGTVMMQGFEQLSLGLLSKQLARQLGVTGVNSFDPFPSARNARAGCEGFFSFVAEKFGEAVDGIIKYIRMAIDWVVDGIKTFFGFRKSARITKEIDDSLGDLKKEFADTLNGLGFPSKQYNVENFLGELPAGKAPALQVMLLKSRMEKDIDAIKGLDATLPILQATIARLNQASDKVDKASNRLKKVIQEQHKLTTLRKQRGEALSMAQAPEVVATVKAIKEVQLTLDIQPISELVGKVYAELYKITFSNEELTQGFDKVRTKLKHDIHTEALKLNPQDVPALMTTIQALNMRYQQISDKQLDLTGVNWKELGKIIDKSDADKIKEMNDFYNFKSVPTEHQLTAEYQRMTMEVRSFTQFCFSVSQALIVVQKQTTNLIEWHNRAHAYYMGGVIGDIKAMQREIEEAKKAGHKPLVDGKGRPRPLMFIKEADAKTFMEKFSGETQAHIQYNMKELETVYNNFARQVGWGMKV